MGVLKRYRETATTEYMKKAIQVHRVVMYEILKDFGTRKHIKDLVLIKQNSDDETRKAIEELEKVINESNIDKPYRAELQVPEHYLSHIRSRFYKLLSDFMDYVTFVYSTWSTLKVEHDARLIAVNKAIGTLYTIKREYCNIDDIIHGKLKNYLKINSMIDEEIILLIGVRNYIRKTIKNNSL